MNLGPVAILGTVILTVACSGCGNGGGSTSSTTPTPRAATTAESSRSALPPGTPATLRAHGGLLGADELSGFSPLGGTAELSTNPQSWLAGIVSSWVGVAGEEFSPGKLAGEAAKLQALGFVAGLGERLRPSQGGQAEAISIVEQLRSSSGARAEIASELGHAGSRRKSTFTVAGIPGSRGFGSSTALNVAFTVGAYYYLVGVGVPSPGTPGLPTRAQVVVAAESLYRRVRVR